MNNTVLVIIVTYNGMKWIDKCIHSVFSSSIHSDIFIVDNASTDGTPNYIKQKFPTVHLTCSNKNLGFGAANNIGLQYALDNNYDYVYLLNQDAWVKGDTFEKLISAQKKHPEYGILSPMQLQANEEHFDFNFGIEISQWKAKSKICEYLFFNQKEVVIPYGMIMAAHWLISRDCFINVGGFSPAFFHYGEDTNYAERCWEKGYKLGVFTAAIAIHDTENRIDSEQKKIFYEYSEKIAEISGFSLSAKNVVWNYTYDIFIKMIFHRKNILCRLNYYKKFILDVPKYLKLKKESLKRKAFLK